MAVYVGEAAPVGSDTLARLLPVNLSPATIRNTMMELAGLGLVEKPHASAGRVPTGQGLRVFVDELLDPMELVEYERRRLADTVGDADAASVIRVASQLLSDRTRQLGFVLSPRLDRLRLQHVSLVRVSSERILAVLISTAGVAHQRVIDDDRVADPAELDRIARALNERLQGRTLRELRAVLADESRNLRRRASRIVQRALEIGERLFDVGEEPPAELVIDNRLALLEQPEFRDPERVRQLFGAIEANEELVTYLDKVLGDREVGVVFGEEVGEPGLRRCALVTAPYGDGKAPLGRLGVLGPSRMDYGRIIPLVSYLSKLLTGRLAS
ncbi:MAG: heat-inducible transcription repressor HrcA [Deltaproteobacteria bacterium]|nr:MAG: heat-inducible transcription repressor HrcA [Deltaproteobacteria bacterium]